jgi:hypothetical protein
MHLYPSPQCSVPVFCVVTNVLHFSNFAVVGSTFVVCIFAKVALPILGNYKWLWIVVGLSCIIFLKIWSQCEAFLKL